MKYEEIVIKNIQNLTKILHNKYKKFSEYQEDTFVNLYVYQKIPMKKTYQVLEKNNMKI